MTVLARIRTRLAAAVCTLSLLSCVAAQAPEDSLQQAFRFLAQHHYQEAADAFSGYIATARAEETGPMSNDGVSGNGSLDIAEQRLTLAMVGAGQALRQLGEHEKALEFFDGALSRQGSLRGEETVRLAAAATAAKIQRHADVLRLCEPLLVDGTLTADMIFQTRQIYLPSLLDQEGPQRVWDYFVGNELNTAANPTIWCDLILRVGFSALQHQQPQLALTAFQWCKASESNAPKHEMIDYGSALAAAGGGESREVAVDRLNRFLADYPNSVYQPRVALAAASLLQRQGRLQDAGELYRRVYEQYPESPEASGAFQGMLLVTPASELNADVVPKSLAILENEAVSPALLLVISELAFRLDSAPLKAAVADRWSRDLPLRRSLPDLLSHYKSRGENSFAIQVAKTVVDQWRASRQHGHEPFPLAEGDVPTSMRHPAATEPPNESIEEIDPGVISAFRLLAVSNEWSYLGNVAKDQAQLSYLGDDEGVVVRLLAEGAFQSGDYSTAVVMFDHLLSTGANSDFDTLLRRAEIAMATEPKNAAAERIVAAKELSSTPTESALIAILQSQWLIRDTRMEDARLALEELMRAPDVPNELKARAKWLRGETYFLQRQYAEAVNEYRSVGSMDESGYWSAAALLQSGRAFEQLQRPRDAAICYTGLISTNKVGPFVDEAKRRLAQIGSSTDKR